MKTYAKVTKLKPVKVIADAAAFFGPKGAGMTQKEKGDDFISFEGGGGYVSVSLCEKDKKLEVNLETREWEAWVERFLENLK